MEVLLHAGPHEPGRDQLGRGADAGVGQVVHQSEDVSAEGGGDPGPRRARRVIHQSLTRGESSIPELQRVTRCPELGQRRILTLGGGHGVKVVQWRLRHQEHRHRS